MSLQLPPRVRRAALTAFMVSGLLLLGACSKQSETQIERLAQPVGATDRTGAIHSLWMWSWLAAMLVGVLVWGLIGYACWKFRRRSDDEVPVQTRYNLPIEILYTVAPVVMVLVFFYYTVTVQNEVLAPANGNEAPSGAEVSQASQADHVVKVMGQKWSWTFNYYQDPALDGSTTVYESGTPAYRPTLWLPVGKSVNIQLSSPDVIHSFWVPAFLFKMDVIPGRHNQFTFTPTRKGTFVGRCAELCGVYHSRMLFDVKVVDESRYAAYLQRLKQQGDTGLVLGPDSIGVKRQAGLEQKGAGQ